MKTASYQIDMCHGALLPKIILFAMPLIFTSMMQLLFNALDLVVIGHYSTHQSMAAIGSTANLIALLINSFSGLAIGTNVLAARYFGAKDEKNLQLTVHTSIAAAFYCGALVTVFGMLAAEPILRLMDTPEDVLPLSCRYVRIFFFSVPAVLLFNFGSAVMRSAGDTRRPMYYLLIAGVIKVLLNLSFVVGLGWDIGGVAAATAISHGLAAILVLRALLKAEDSCCFRWKKMKLDRKNFLEMLRIGIPAGLQSSLFAISNMLIQSSINSFGSLAIAGATATINLESLIVTSGSAFHQATISFVSQNLGADKLKRVIRSIADCMGCALVVTAVLGMLCYFFGEALLSLFSDDPEVIRWGMERGKILFLTYFLCGFMDISTGGLRGMGYSLCATIIALFGMCFLRIAWVLLVFPHHRTMGTLMVTYPLSWLTAGLLGYALLWYLLRKMAREKVRRHVEWSPMGMGVQRGYGIIGNSR